jgi:hypothetical protein
VSRIFRTSSTAQSCGGFFAQADKMQNKLEAIFMNNDRGIVKFYCVEIKILPELAMHSGRNFINLAKFRGIFQF